MDSLEVVLNYLEDKEKKLKCRKPFETWTKCIINPANNIEHHFVCNELLNNYISCLEENPKKTK